MIDLYAQHGWSMLPVKPRDKMPDGPWKAAQTERASLTDVAQWLLDGRNIGVATGALSGIVVVDCDSAKAAARVSELGHEPTPTVLTGRGVHLIFRHPGQPVKNAVAIEDGIDIRGDGGFAVIPPSIHPSGEPYRWATGLSLEDVVPAELPAWAVRVAQVPQNGREPGEWTALFTSQVPNGQRNQRLAELSGYLLRRHLEPGLVGAICQLWNERYCTPAMSTGEVRRTVKSIAAREAARRDARAF